MNKAPPKQKEFSDPLKEGILAAKQGLRVQDKPREKKEDELKMSILNARKGLKKATSQGDATLEAKKESNLSGRGGREGTPEVEEEEINVKVEEVTPKKGSEILGEEPLRRMKLEASPSATKPIERGVSKFETKPDERSSPLKAVSPKSPPAVTRKLSASKPAPPSKSKTTEASPPKVTTIPESLQVSTKPLEENASPLRITETSNLASLSTKPSEETATPSKASTTPKSPPLSSKSSISQQKTATTPSVQKKEIDPTFKFVTKVETPRKEDDSPTPRKKFPKPETMENPTVESSLKSLDPMKQKPLPTPPKEPLSSVKGTVQQRKMLMRFNCGSV